MGKQTTVDTGERSVYVFKVRHPGDLIEIYCNGRGYDDRLERHYHDIEGKGVTAVRRLVESHGELREFFDAMRLLAIFDHHGRLIGFKQHEDCDTDELETAREKVADIFEAVADFEGLEL